MRGGIGPAVSIWSLSCPFRCSHVDVAAFVSAHCVKPSITSGERGLPSRPWVHGAEHGLTGGLWRRAAPHAGISGESGGGLLRIGEGVAVRSLSASGSKAGPCCSIATGTCQGTTRIMECGVCLTCRFFGPVRPCRTGQGCTG